jgi:hypothetical protein
MSASDSESKLVIRFQTGKRMAAKTSDSPETHFLNVDLDIYSKRDLQPLVKAFGSKVHVLYVGRERAKYSAHLEIAGLTKTADSTLRAFCRLIERLPERARRLWTSATVRSFSIGIRAGTHPNPCDFTIQPGTVKAVSDLGAEIVLTIYAPEQHRVIS